MTGMKPATLKRWIKAQESRQRAARFGVPADHFELLPEGVQAALQQSRLRPVFVEAARLASDAHMTTSAIRFIVREANAAGSEREALMLLAAHREARAADIKTIRAGFKAPRPRSAGAAPHLAALMKYEASDLTDIPPDKIPDAIARMEKLHTQLGAALAQLRDSLLMPVGAGAHEARDAA
jgi:hypothetical protein